MKQLYPSEPQGNVARHLNTLAGLVTGIVLSKSCQLPALASKAPDETLAESRNKRFSRWLQNGTVTPETYFLPFVQAFLTNLAQARPLVFIMDGSEIGHGCLALVISVVYAQRALPIAWIVVRGNKGHFPADTHVRLLREVVERMPLNSTAQFLGDGEFDSPQLQQALDACQWTYVCRTAKNTRIQRDGAWVGLASIDVHRGRKKMWSAVCFTQAGYGPVQVIGWWDSACDEPLYLVTNLTDRDNACRAYQKRMVIETLFSDQKSRGFRLNQSHLSDPERLSRLLTLAPRLRAAQVQVLLLAWRTGGSSTWAPWLHNPIGGGWCIGPTAVISVSFNSACVCSPSGWMTMRLCVSLSCRRRRERKPSS